MIIISETLHAKVWASIALVLICVNCSGERTVIGNDAYADSSFAPGTEHGPCYGNGTCNKGLVCVSKRCVGTSDMTIAGDITHLDLGKKETGDACSSNKECRYDLCLKKLTSVAMVFTFHKGYCSKECNSSSKCNENSVCVPFPIVPKSEQYCIRKCNSSSDCRTVDGYVCTGGSVCMPK